MREIWMHLFWALAIVFGGVVAYLHIQSVTEQMQVCQSEIDSIQEKYSTLATSQRYWLDTIIMNEVPVKQYMKEYKDMDDKEFSEALRRKLVELDLMLKEIKSK